VRRGGRSQRRPRRCRRRVPGRAGGDRRCSKKGANFGDLRLQIVLAVLGGAALIFGIKETILGSKAKDTPQTITCADLAARGYGDNAHVKLTDVIPLLMNHVAIIDSKTGRRLETWVPLMPDDGGAFSERVYELAEREYGGEDVSRQLDQLAAQADFRVVFRSKEFANAAAFDRWLDDPNLPYQGLVINDIEGVDSDVRAFFAQNYPNTNPDRVWIVEHNRKATAGPLALLAMLGGGVLIVAAVIWLVMSLSGGNSSAPRGAGGPGRRPAAPRGGPRPARVGATRPPTRGYRR
jgi:hypothetical protein